MEDMSPQDIYSSSKSEKDDKITHNHFRTNCGICCICHRPPVHSKNYYGHVFCKDCFYKYIFSHAKNECSGDITKKETDTKGDKKEVNEVKKEVKEVNKEANEFKKEANDVSKEVNEVNKEVNEVNKEANEVNKEANELNKEGNEVNKEDNEVKKEVKEDAVEVA